MVKGKYSTYEPLAVRRQHATNMKVILLCLFAVLVLTGITGHLFSRRDEALPSPPPASPHHEALAKLIRTSEDAIGWIGNKTLDSINNIKNLTASAVTPESALGAKKNKLLNWLRMVAHYNGSAESTATGAGSREQSLEDSGERMVIAHRTPDNRFKWGPPRQDGAESSSSSGFLHATGRSVHNVLSYLLNTSRNITRRGREFLQSGIDKVKSAKESVGERISKWSEKRKEVSTSATPVPPTVDAGEPCDDVTDNVCAVDWARGVYTIFRNGCWARVYNEKHGTNFSIHDSDVCINLFTHNPENYQKIDNPAL